MTKIIELNDTFKGVFDFWSDETIIEDINDYLNNLCKHNNDKKVTIKIEVIIEND